MKKSQVMFLLLFASVLLTISCSNNKIAEEKESTPTYETLAKAKFKSGFETIKNRPQDFILCINKTKMLPSASATSFFIYDIKNQKVVFEETVNMGKVEWVNDYQLKISSTPGIVRGDEKEENSGTYYFDVKSGKKTNQLININE